MDRAARAFVDWFQKNYPDTQRPVLILAGAGNNGGDGLAAARMLHYEFYPVKVWVCDFSGKRSADFDAQLAALPPNERVELTRLDPAAPWPALPPETLVIDALFGSGLNRPLEGAWATAVERLNQLPNEKVAMDLPSGLFADQPTTGPCVQAARTFSFQTPKLAFFMPENAARVGEWSVGPIGLHPAFERQADSPFQLATAADARALVRPRPRFSHKGSFGHALLINGSLGKMGAAVLAAEACLRSGVGLLSLHTPGCGYEILQTRAPEAMCSIDPSVERWTQVPRLGPFAAIGAGCGIGTEPPTAQALKRLIQTAQVPLVLDADALNLLAQHPNWLAFLPPGTVLTPHPKEFERLFGPSENGFARLELAREKARVHQVYLVLKGAWSVTVCPDGRCWFNSTGNPGMATGGSGDVLAGLLTGLLAQAYPPEAACVLGVFLHGLAGDLAARENSQAGMTAGDLPVFFSKAWRTLAP